MRLLCSLLLIGIFLKHFQYSVSISLFLSFMFSSLAHVISVVLFFDALPIIRFIYLYEWKQKIFSHKRQSVIPCFQLEHAISKHLHFYSIPIVRRKTASSQERLLCETKSHIDALLNITILTSSCLDLIIIYPPYPTNLHFLLSFLISHFIQ